MVINTHFRRLGVSLPIQLDTLQRGPLACILMAMHVPGLRTFVWLSSIQMLSFLSALLKCRSEG